MHDNINNIDWCYDQFNCINDKKLTITINRSTRVIDTVVSQTAPFDNEQQSINTAYLHFVEGLPVLDAILL